MIKKIVNDNKWTNLHKSKNHGKMKKYSYQNKIKKKGDEASIVDNQMKKIKIKNKSKEHFSQPKRPYQICKPSHETRIIQRKAKGNKAQVQHQKNTT